MKSTIASFKSVSLIWPRVACLAILLVAAGPTIASTNLSKAFSSPTDAVQALVDAAKTKDRPALKEILGPAIADFRMSDQVQVDTEMTEFAAAFDDNHRLVRKADDRATLEVGTNSWPFPVPLVQKDAQWRFDTDAGVEELVNRRVGRNELSALSTVRAFVDAQREYARKDRDGDEVLEYAQHILSASGQKDGLYWSPNLDGEISPLVPLVAAAQAEGYRKSTGEKSGPAPFHGYCFKVLTYQGSRAPGGQYNYVINGNMIGGFALVAWPADYGDSGVMTFIVNQRGKVYQKDLGAKTGSIVQAMREYNPDKTWTLSPD